MFALVPEVKLTYLVRDPLQRTESHYYHRYFKHLNREIKVRTRSVRTSRTAERVRRSPPAEIGRRMLPVRVREPLFARRSGCCHRRAA